MRIHIIQTGSVAIKQSQHEGRDKGNPLINVLTDRTWTEPLPIYAFVIEHAEGLLVVDTGETARTRTPGYFPFWQPYFKLAVREWVQPDQEIGPQMRALGLNPNDVRWVVMTHLHTDHAGGLAHFPKAQILVSRREYQDALGFRGQVNGYLPHRWPAWFQPTFIDMQPAALGPFTHSFQLTQAGDVHVLPTPGHTPGHVSVLIHAPEANYFLAGDVSYTQALMLQQRVDGVSNDRAAARDTLAKVKALCQSQSAVYLPAHDPDSVDRLMQRTPALAT